MKTFLRILIVLSFLGFADLSLYAGGPLYVVEGDPVLWSESSIPITYHIDPGTLGPLTKGEASDLIEQAFSMLEESPGTRVQFQRGEDLPTDITLENYETYYNDPDYAWNPIIFDDDGSIIRDLNGEGAEEQMLGLANIVREGEEIQAAQVVFNGRYIETHNISSSAFLATVLHELGHFIGLDHSQQLRHMAYDLVGWNDVHVPIMFPTSTDDESVRTELTHDDKTTVANLYPTQQHWRDTGSIVGTILRQGDEFPGANVIARRIGSVTDHVYSAVSGTYRHNRGSYVIQGLPPGEYQVYVEPIDPIYYGVSSVGQYANFKSSASFQNPPAPQFYTEHPPVSKGRSVWSPVTVSANNFTSRVDIESNTEDSLSNEYLTQILPLDGFDIGALPPADISFFQYLLVPAGDEERILIRVQSKNVSDQFDVVVKMGQPARQSDIPTALSREGVVELDLAPDGDLPLDAERYFIAVINRGTQILSYRISTSTASMLPPTPTPTIPPDPEAVKINPRLGLVALDAFGGTYPRGMGIHNFDVGSWGSEGNFHYGEYDAIPDAGSMARFLYFENQLFPIAEDIEFTGEIDPEGNGSEGVYFLIGGNLHDVPPVLPRLGATGGPNHGGIDANNNPEDNKDYGGFTGDPFPVEFYWSGDSKDKPVFIYDLIDVEPAGNHGFYALDFDGRIYAEGDALEFVDLQSPPPDFRSNTFAVDMEIFRGREIDISNSLYAEDLIGTGAYILDNWGFIYSLGEVPVLQTEFLPVIPQTEDMNYYDIEFLPDPEGNEFIGLGVLRGDGMIQWVPFEDTDNPEQYEEYIRELNPLVLDHLGFPLDIARDFEVEISEDPLYGLDQQGNTIIYSGRRVGVFLFDGYGGVHHGGDTTLYTAHFTDETSKPYLIEGELAQPYRITIPYFGVDLLRDVELTLPVNR